MIIDSIKQTIKDEGFKPGDRFYSEKVLMEQLGVSRASVREAIRMLEVSGVFTVRQGKGVFLRNQQEEQFAPAREWLEANAPVLEEQFEVRRLLEPHGAEKAAENADAPFSAILRELHEEFCRASESSDINVCIKTDARFHMALARQSGNKTLKIILKAMIEGLSDTWMASLLTPGRREKTIKEHEEIIIAVEESDSERAALMMSCHLEQALKDIRLYQVEQKENKA